MFRPTSTRQAPYNPQDGFALVGLIVAIFIILLALSVAAPTVARALRREREVEAVHRADEYVNAIRRYHLKTGAYPGSIEQLEKTNNIRYIRQKYPDPMTGKPDWRLIKVGENKTTVKGFFGQPLAGLANTGVGGASVGMSSNTNSLATGTTPGLTSNSPGGSNSSTGATPSSAGSVISGSGGAPSSDPGSSLGSNSGSPGSSGALGSSSNVSGSGGIGSGSSGSAAPFLGVGVPTAGSAIIVVNEQTTYPEWEFLYDPRIEQLRAKVNIFGGGMSSTSSSGLGSLSNNQSNMPTSTGSPTTPPPTPSAPQ